MGVFINVLIIEDSQDDAILITRKIEKGDFAVNWKRVENEKELIKALNENHWDLVITDYTLPNFNGMIALALLSEKHPDLPVIMISGEAGEETVVEAMRLGASDYIVKGNYARLIPSIKRELKETKNINEKKIAEEKYRLLAENVYDVIWTANENLQITFVSPSITRLTGFSVQEIVGKSINEFVDVESFRDIAENFKLDMSNNNQQSHHPKTIDTMQFCKDGSKKNIEVTISLIRNDTGKPTGILGVTRDITKRKKVEEQLRQSEKMEAIGQLAGGIAHDFNNQLTAISGYADLIKTELGDNALLVRYIDTISRASVRSADLTKKLLAFSRISKLLSVPTDIHECINEVIDLLKRSVDKRIKIETVLNAEHPVTRGDPSELQNAMLNIAINACHAMNGNGSLVFKTEIIVLPEEYVKKYSKDALAGNYIQVIVSDTGCGMSKEVMSHIFEPFYTTKKEGEGTGMGLAAVYGTVQSHKGFVTVSSEPDSGTEFRINLPLFEIHNDVVSFGKTGELIRGTGNVLVVDDEVIVLEMVIAMLEDLGYSSKTCVNGAEAVECYKENWHDFDLVILDMIMPELNGIDALEIMRKINPDIKVIFSSGFGIDENAQKYFDQGVASVIQKPFKMVELSHKIANVLSGEFSKN